MFRDYINKNKENFLKDLYDLLRIDTVLVEQPEVKDAPFGPNLVKALNYCLDLGRKCGFKTTNIDNIVGEIEMGKGDETIAMLCHLDVVPTGTGWTTPPFEPNIRDGKLFARGSLDDKGAAIASLYAMKAINELGIKLNKKVILILGTDEETGTRDMKRYLEVRPMPTMGFSPDAQFPLIYGEKGIMSIDIKIKAEDDGLEVESGDRYNVVPQEAWAKGIKDTSDYLKYLEKTNSKGKLEEDKIYAYGLRAHAMEPKLGINAILKLCNYLKDKTNNKLVHFVSDCLNDSRFKDIDLDFTDYEMGDLTCNLALMNLKSGVGKIGLNLRYPVRWKKEEFLNALTKKATEYDLSVEVIHDSVPLYVNPNSDLIKTLHKAYVKVTKDDKTPLLTIGGGTYARYLKNCVAFGPLKPGREDVCHIVDEYIYLEDLLDSCEIYAEALAELGK